MACLNGLAAAQPFPFVGSEFIWRRFMKAALIRLSVAVGVFNAVVQFEIQRRENSAKAKALVLQMADMLGALLVSGKVLLLGRGSEP